MRHTLRKPGYASGGTARRDDLAAAVNPLLTLSDSRGKSVATNPPAGKLFQAQSRRPRPASLASSSTGGPRATSTVKKRARFPLGKAVAAFAPPRALSLGGPASANTDGVFATSSPLRAALMRQAALARRASASPSHSLPLAPAVAAVTTAAETAGLPGWEAELKFAAQKALHPFRPGRVPLRARDRRVFRPQGCVSEDLPQDPQDPHIPSSL